MTSENLLSAYNNHPAQQRTQLRTWTIGVFAALVLFIVFAGMWLNTLGPLFLFVCAMLVLATPLLVSHQKGVLWLWLVAFPIFYYDPIRLASVVLRELEGIVVPLFLFLAMPGALTTLVARPREYLGMLPLTFPLWVLLTAFVLDGLRLFSLYEPKYWVRDMLSVVMVLYLLTIVWQICKAGELQRKTLFKVLFGVGMFNTFAIIFEHYFHIGLVNAGGYQRPMGLFGFPIQASFFSLLTFILCIYRFFNADSKRGRFFYGTSLILVLLSCLMSMTKTNILQLGMLLGIFGLFLPRAQKRRALRFAMLLAFLMLLWEIFIDHGNLLTQLNSRFSQTETLSIRQSAWNIVISNLDWNTLLWGNGWLSATELLGTYNYNYALFPVDLPNKGGASAIHPHNAYIKYLYELGLLGVGMLLGYLFLMIKGFYLSLQKTALNIRLANLSVGCVTLVVLFASLTTSPTADFYPLLFFNVALTYFAYHAGWFEAPWFEQQPPPTAETETARQHSW